MTVQELITALEYFDLQQEVVFEVQWNVNPDIRKVVSGFINEPDSNGNWGESAERKVILQP